MIISNSNCPNSAALSFGKEKVSASTIKKVNIPYSQVPSSVSGDNALRLINFVEFTNGLKAIKSIEKEFLANQKDAVDYDDLEIKKDKNYRDMHRRKEISGEELFMMNLLSPDIYCLNGKPYTGFTNGPIAYSKFNNGEFLMSFIKDDEKGITGYTDEKKESSKYCRITPDQKTLVESQYKDGACHIRLTNINKKAVSIKNFKITDNGINNPEMQKFLQEFNKYFDGEIDDSYVVFA